MKNPKFLWLLLGCLTVAVMSGHKASASHTMGADLTYTHIGGSTYRVTLSFYRDCSGIPAPATAAIKVLSASCGDSLGVTCYPRTGTGQEVTPNCNSAVTTCNGGAFTGIQEWIYDGIVTLPRACSDWTFSYNLCCRNAAVTNISNPTASTFYIYATLNNIGGLSNNSPSFTNNPVPFLCLGQRFAFNHGAYDTDGDSLVFQLVAPQRTATSNVNYIIPFSPSNPLSSSPATSFNPQTGDIIMTPQNMEVTVMAVLVSEYRNGILLGTVERDLQLTVMTCSNNLPSLTGINGTNNFTIDVCAGQQVCFDVLSSDIDSSQHLTVSWNNSIPGAVFSSTGGNRPNGRFCWTPSGSDAGNSYTFTATVTDDACPYVGTQVYAYTVNVSGLQVNIASNTATACSGIETLTANVTGGNSVYSYSWNNGSTASSLIAGPGTWSVTVSDGRCSASATATVNSVNQVTAAFSAAAQGCTNTPVSFTDQSVTTNGSITNWYWNFGDGSVSTIQHPAHSYSAAGTYFAYLIATNNSGCSDTAVQSIVIGQQPHAVFTVQNGCAGTSFAFNNQDPSSATSWTWDFGNGSTSNMASPVTTFTAAGTYTVTLTGSSGNGCSASTSTIVSVFAVPVASAGADQTICAGTTTSLSATGGTSYTWIPGGTGASISLQPSSTGSYVVVAANAYGCSATDTVTVSVLPSPTVNTGSDITSCNGQTVNLSATGATAYSWTPGGMSGSNVTVTPGTSTTYTVIGTNNYGCSASDVISVQVSQTPIVNAGTDITICQGSAATLTANGGMSYSWDVTGQTTASIRVSPSWTTTYTVSATNGSGCSGSDYVTVTVLPAPHVQLQPQFLCIGSSVTLNPNVTAAAYAWTPGGQTTPSITVNQSGTYGITITDVNGCTSTASATVTGGTSLMVNLSDVTFCHHDTVVLNAGNPGMNYLWTPGGETTQAISIYNSGTYGVTVTDPAGCTGAVTISATETPSPTAYWTATTACEGGPTQFTNSSSIIGLNNNRYHWNFGDGSHSNLENPTYTYSQPGRYPVHLTIHSGNGCSAPYNGWVYVNPLPSASFEVADICNGQTAAFNNLSTVSEGNISSYHWDFGDGDTSNAVHPNHFYQSPGAMTVTLTVTSSGGCTSSVQRTLNIYPNPVAAVSGGSACNGIALTPGNGSSIASGSIASYSWSFGDGTSSSQMNPTHSYGAPGNYLLSLTVTSSEGCSDTATATATIFANPTANAGPDRSICPGSTTVLTATGGNSFYWLPSNIAGASLNVSPSVTTTYTVIVTDANGCIASDAMTVNVLQAPVAYASGTGSICAGQTATLMGSGGSSLTWSPGGMTAATISVQPAVTTDYVLTVTDLNGCTARDTIRIQVHRLPTLTISPNQSICSGSSVTLSASGAFYYSWGPIGASGPVIAFTPQNSGSYTVTGTSLEGCSATASVNVTVNQTPQVLLPPAFYCQGHATTLDAGNPGSSYLWSNGQTTQQIHVSANGNYSVVVTGANGCPGTGATVVTEAGNLQAMPTADAICAGASTVLNAGNPGSNYLWSTGETTQTIVTSGAGTYSVTITDAFGCSATMNHLVSVHPLPTALFSANPVCSGAQMNFINNSVVSGGTIQQSVWTFGNGSYSNSVSPNYTYTAAGTYTVGLTVTSSNGCTASTNASVTVHPLPVADFSATASCLGTATTFTDASSVASGSIASWEWNFGDNTPSVTGAAPSHTYVTAGNYDATLIISSTNGCKDTIDRFLTVYGLPNASFTVTSTCTNSGVVFQNTSTSMWGNITSYQWNFGDGTTSSAVVPQHSYSAAGTYAILLTATTVNGCTQSATRTVNAFELPQASFLATPACAGSPVSFQNNSSVSGGTITSSYWNLGGGVISSVTNPTWMFSNEGNYPVSLVVISNNGCRDTINGAVTVHPLPAPSFAATDVCLNNANSFNDLSSINGGSITGWNWDFGDNTTATGSATTHTYSTAGTFAVQLTATSNNGCTAIVRSDVNVFPNPEVSFSASNVCLGIPVQFINNSTVSGGIATTSDWLFSNGSTSTAVNPVITFAAAGNYQAALTVTSAQGCISQASLPVTVYRAPQATISSTGSCENTDIQFNDGSTSQDGAITRWVWTFGDGGATVQQQPTHVYGTAGQYTASLYITSEFGCKDTATIDIQVHEQPTPVIVTGDACEGAPVQFAATGAGLTGYQWTFGNGQTSNDAAFTWTFQQAGNYPVGLTAINTFGCIGTAASAFTIHPNPIAGFLANPVCIGARTIFSNTTFIPGGNISTYTWTFGDGQQSTATHPNHAFQTPGSYQAVLTAVSDHGCTSTFNRSVDVHALPTVDFSTGVQGCSPVLFTPTDLSVATDGTVTGWLWDFGDGEISTDNRPSHTYTTSGNFNVSLTVVSSFGCQSYASRPGFVTVFPGPDAEFAMNGNATDLNPLIQFTNLSQGYTAFQWNFGDGQTDNTHPSPTHLYDELGSYTVSLMTVNSFGCKDTTYKVIEVRPTSTLYAPNCFTPNGDGKNDVFKPEFTNMTDLEVWVFDRWGLLISHFDGMNSHWDGYYGNRKCQTDTYVYKIKGKGIEGKDYEWIGHVSIVY